MQIVTTHKNTDFDGCASAVAATLLYPEAVAVLPRTLNPNVRWFLSIHKELFPYMSADQVDFARVRRLIVVDTASWERLDRLDMLRQRADLEIWVWDHHDDEGTLAASRCRREKTGATVSLLVEELRRLRTGLSPMQATLFLAGIYEDTGHLTFPATTSRDAYAAAYLLECKADLGVLQNFLRPVYGEKQKEILFQMLQDAPRKKINGLSLSVRTVEVRGHADSLSVVVGMYMDIVNVDAAFGIFVDPERGRCMLIGRSRVEQIDVGAIMRSFGGGGHPGAGSAVLKAGNPAAVTEMIESMIRGNQQGSVQIGDLMSYPVITVGPRETMKAAAMLLREKGVTGLPVVDGGRLVGMLSRRDFRKVRRPADLERPVKAFMATRVLSIDPRQSLMQAARLMVKHDIGRLPVVQDGRLIGILTRSDTMRYFYDLLPN